MNGKTKFHKATGPAFHVGQVWVDASGRTVEIVDVARYLGVLSNHMSDYSVQYRDSSGNLYEKDAWNFQVRYTHNADTVV